MKPASRSFVRVAAVILGTGGVFLGSAGTATADPTPGCTLGDVTAVMGEVSGAMTDYLFSHPDVNNFLTGLQGQNKSDVGQQTQDYLNANPQVRNEMTAIRQPAVDLRNRCGIPLQVEIASVL